MGLGTIDTVSSLAFVIIPPGNIVKDIADIRMRLWTLKGAASARAYFDFPVVAWLGSAVSGATLAGIASRTSTPLELCGPERHNDDLFLRFSEDRVADILGITSALPLATDKTEHAPGPFEAGIGCFCARIPLLPVDKPSLDSKIAPIKLRATTYLLAIIELRWMPEPGYSSSWATLSSARSGRSRA